jgi:hypothetical protein
MESPTPLTLTTSANSDIHFQLSLLRFLSQGEKAMPQIEQVEQLLSRVRQK